MIGTNGVLHTWGETRLWPVWGGWDVAEQREGFGAFRFLGDAPPRVQLCVPVDSMFGTTTIEPRPKFCVVSGALPLGLELAPDGRISGTPEVAGTSGPITIVADNGKAPSSSTTLNVTVAEAT